VAGLGSCRWEGLRGTGPPDKSLRVVLALDLIKQSRPWKLAQRAWNRRPEPSNSYAVCMTGIRHERRLQNSVADGTRALIQKLVYRPITLSGSP
jgi:hypothetical protein